MPVLTRQHVILLSWGIILGASLIVLGQINRKSPGIAVRNARGSTIQNTADSIVDKMSNDLLTPVTLLEGVGPGGQFRVVQYHPFRTPFDINTVPVEIIDTLPGISKRVAERIVEHRKSIGPFRSVDELRDVAKISPEKMQIIAPLIQVSP